MPRGVPRNRALPAGNSPTPPTAEPAVAVGPVDIPAPAQTPTPAPPAPPVELTLTADQIMIRELRNQLALERGKKDGEPQLDPVAQPGDQENILIHFLEDGLTAGGQVWYRGQEIEYEPGSRAYQDTFDRLGRSWLDLRNDEFAQVERWGKVMFRTGPWPGKKLSEAKVEFEKVRNDRGEVVASPSAEDLAKFEAAEAKRRRAAARLEEITS